MIGTIDNYLFNTIAAKLNPRFFKFRPLQIFAIAYISLFPLPRKFLIHYFKGNGRKLLVKTKNVILSNPLVLSEITRQINKVDDESFKCIPINQRYLSDPNYRYSIGSFNLNIKLTDNVITLYLTSEYKYTTNTNRVTQYIHNWLNAFCYRGIANTFLVEGTSWFLTVDRLFEYEKKIKKNATFGNISG